MRALFLFLLMYGATHSQAAEEPTCSPSPGPVSQCESYLQKSQVHFAGTNGGHGRLWTFEADGRLKLCQAQISARGGNYVREETLEGAVHTIESFCLSPTKDFPLFGQTCIAGQRATLKITTDSQGRVTRVGITPPEGKIGLIQRSIGTFEHTESGCWPETEYIKGEMRHRLIYNFGLCQKVLSIHPNTSESARALLVERYYKELKKRDEYKDLHPREISEKKVLDMCSDDPALLEVLAKAKSGDPQTLSVPGSAPSAPNKALD